MKSIRCQLARAVPGAQVLHNAVAHAELAAAVLLSHAHRHAHLHIKELEMI